MKIQHGEDVAAGRFFHFFRVCHCLGHVWFDVVHSHLGVIFEMQDGRLCGEGVSQRFETLPPSPCLQGLDRAHVGKGWIKPVQSLNARGIAGVHIGEHA